MWKCTRCGLELMFRAVTPEIDQDGCYFLCVGCGHRNPLVNIGGPDDNIALVQPSE